MMWGYGMSWFGWVVMFAWWALFVVGILWLVRNVVDRPERGSDARRILDERFASGDLTIEEYEARRRALR